MSMTLENLSAFGEKFGRDMLARNRPIIPLLHVWDSQKDAMYVFDFKGENENEMKWRAIKFVSMLRRNGTFGGAQMVAEAWIAHYAKDELKPGYTRPANRPDREEVYLVTSWDAQGKREVKMFPILRTNGYGFLGKEKDVNVPGASYQTWLDSAFTDPEKMLNNSPGDRDNR